MSDPFAGAKRNPTPRPTKPDRHANAVRVNSRRINAIGGVIGRGRWHQQYCEYKLSVLYWSTGRFLPICLEVTVHGW